AYSKSCPGWSSSISITPFGPSTSERRSLNESVHRTKRGPHNAGKVESLLHRDVVSGDETNPYRGRHLQSLESNNLIPLAAMVSYLFCLLLHVRSLSFPATHRYIVIVRRSNLLIA
ncbi:unnamed protein product, partial [Musa acuminata subsp. burmannicoides]